MDFGADCRVDHYGDELQCAGRFDDVSQRPQLSFVIELARNAVARREHGPLLGMQQ